MRIKNCLNRPALLASCITLLLMAAVYGLILKNNGGTFTYTLDDPYIHLRVAQNISQGHYGINATEFSSPASSIIWPFILAPVADFAQAPLFINILCSLITIIIFSSTIRQTIGDYAGTLTQTTLVFLLILATNLIGLAFTGMEHSLQIMLTAMVVPGLIETHKTGKVPAYLLAALALAPLVRYENMAISLFCAIYLYLVCRSPRALAAVALSLLVIGLFSVFLLSRDLPPLPSSVIAKTSGKDDGFLVSMLSKVFKSPTKVPGIFLSLIALASAYGLVNIQDRNTRLTSGLLFLCVISHLCLGKYNWYHRYELYIWTFSLLMAIYLCKNPLNRLLSARHGNLKIAIAACFLTYIMCHDYIKDLDTLHKAAHNIYQQQYQMMRFAQDYAKTPVAVNDIGLVSYNNPDYVLDLWGLASYTALQHRLGKNDSQWIEPLAIQHRIELAMIYDEWIENIPTSWIAIGNLTIKGKLVTPAHRTVSFYATSEAAAQTIRAKLPDFIKTLPADVRFEQQ